MPAVLTAVLLCLAVFSTAEAAITVDCGINSVSVQWIDVSSQVDPSQLRLGDCTPSQVSVNAGGLEAVFSVQLGSCGMRRLVTGNQIVYETEITSTLAKVPLVYYPVVCVYERPEHWSPPLYSPLLFQSQGIGELAFHLTLMTSDFTAAATSTTFQLGSMIPISASVDQQVHQPLILFLEECLASTTSQLSPESQIYPLITNKGCLTDSKTTNSRFLPRNNISEIRLYLQAFKFAIGEDIYLHCKLVAWDPMGLDVGKKACQYDQVNSRWVLFDNPPQSSLCNCCDSNCSAKRRRETFDGSFGATSVVGPLTIV